MDLKHTNYNNKLVLASKLNHVELFFGKIVEMQYQNESCELFFDGDAMIAHKTNNH